MVKFRPIFLESIVISNQFYTVFTLDLPKLVTFSTVLLGVNSVMFSPIICLGCEEFHVR